MLAQIVGIAVGSQPGALTLSMLKELKLMGISITDKSLVRSGDAIRPIVSRAAAANDVVIILSNGDPHTDRLVSESICAAFGLAPKLNPQAREAIDSYYAGQGQPPTREQQGRAMLPHGAVVFPNEKGIQPAYAVQSGNRLILVLPGDKKELSPIFLESVLPMLSKLAPHRTVSHLISCYSTTPQDAEARLGALLASTNPIVTLYTIGSGCTARVTATAATEKQAKDSAQTALRTVVSRLGAAASAIDAPIGLENALAKAAQGARATLATAEISPTPVLSRRVSRSRKLESSLKAAHGFSSLREASSKLGVSASQIANWGEQSQQTAAALAQAVRRRSGATWGAALVAPQDMYRQGKLFAAVANDKTVWVRGYTVNPSLGADYQLQYCTEELLCLFWQVVSTKGDFPGGQPLAKLLKGAPVQSALPAPRQTAALTAAAPSKTASAAPARKSGSTPVVPAGGKSKSAKPKKKESFFQNVSNILIPQKGDGFADLLRKTVLILSIIVFTGSVSYLVNNKVDTVTTRNMYEGLSEQMYDPDTDTDYTVSNEYPADYQLKFAKLWEQNPDIVGYLTIPNTTVNYPVVQTTLTDDTGENYYHRRDFTRASNSHGTPYADYESDIKRPSEQIIIYGHNMTDGLMFGEVDKYKNLSFYQQAPIINFDSVYKNGQYKIFSVFITNSLPEHGEVFNYHMFINAKDQAHFDQYVAEVRDRSFYDIPVDVKYGDELLTLSTCNYYYNGIRMFDEARLVVVARRVRNFESASVDVSAVTMNEDAKHPDAWYTVMEGAKKKAAEAIDSVTIGGERTLYMDIGDTMPLYYTISPETATNKKVTWTSSDSNVVTVNSSGQITAVGGGTAAVTVTTQAGGEKTDSIKVIVNQPQALEVTGIYLNETSLDLELDDTQTLRVTIEPAGAAAELMWDSSDWNAVRVSDESADGTKAIVSAKAVASEVVVSVYTQDGQFYDECIINVTGDGEDAIAIEEICLDDEKLSLEAGEKVRMSYEIYPEDATGSIKWSSSNTAVATVDTSGRVTAVSAGTAVITAAAPNSGYSTTCTITVTGSAADVPAEGTTGKVTGVSLDKESISLSPGDTYGLSAAVSPPEAEDQRVRWSSSNTSVATVDSSGKVTAKGGGKAVITATTRDGGFTATCEVLVQADSDNIPVEGISVNRTSLEMWVGDGRTVSYSISPTDATNQKVSWSSSDTSVATVKNGEVRGVGEGTAIITVKTNDGGHIAEVKVTVEIDEDDPPKEETKPEQPKEETPSDSSSSDNAAESESEAPTPAPEQSAPTDSGSEASLE